MRLDDYPTDPRYTATILKTEPITEEGADAEVRELVIEVEDHDFDFEIGQSIGVLVPGPVEFGGSLHHRLYTVADLPNKGGDGKPQITLVVRRCTYIDDYSGEEYIGINSNFLCDCKVGDTITITGPFGMPFKVPDDRAANLFLIGMGTGIAPFRGLMKHIYGKVGDWKGKVRLLYGARSGLEMLYMNDKRDDFTNYYDEETFEAFKALSPRPNWSDPIAWDYAVKERADEISEMLNDEHTYVYVAGQKRIRDSLDDLFAGMSGSAEAWAKQKEALVEQDRWVELLY
jgi:ferredoxin--NADP+ reductase